MSNPGPTPTQSARSPRSPFAPWIAGAAAFAVYFCMYAFRKPFSAGTFDDQTVYSGFDLKTVLVLSQLCGYMLSKFIGVKLVSEMPRSRRAFAIVGLIAFAELALLGFAYLPMPVRPLMMFLNGLPLGMIFGLVMAFLEGRKQTEALAAGLCASFIVSSGVVKSVGRWLIEDQGVSEFDMPWITGLMFFPPLLLFVWLLQRTPEPTAADLQLRSERPVMTAAQRWAFFRAYMPGLVALLFVYIMLTIIRTVRDDFGVEIWKALGVDGKPDVFARSETIVAVAATALNALAICVVRNLTAIRLATWLMCGGFVIVAVSAGMQWSGSLSPFAFMVCCGIGLYIPYVAFHTTIFERLISASKRPGNLGFLMYLADSIGYLGYAAIMVWKTASPPGQGVFEPFRIALVLTAILSVAALLFTDFYFRRTLTTEETSAATDLAAKERPDVS